MAENITLTQTRIRAGIWEGVLTGVPHPAALAEAGAGGAIAANALQIDVVLLEEALAGVTLTPIPERQSEWQLRAPIPAAAINEGVQTFVIRHGGQMLAHFTLVTGGALEDDLRAEVDLLRAELDLLKRAFRRHCVETGS